MEVAQATWNSQLDDLQSAQRSKYQEFVLELYAIYKRRRLQAEHNAQKDITDGHQLLDGKDMVSEAMRAIGERRSNVERTEGTSHAVGHAAAESSRDLPVVPSPPPSQPPPSEADTPAPQTVQEPAPRSTASANQEATVAEQPPKPPPTEEDPELNRMIQSILEMGFDVEQAKGALLIANRNMVCSLSHKLDLFEIDTHAVFLIPPLTSH